MVDVPSNVADVQDANDFSLPEARQRPWVGGPALIALGPLRVEAVTPVYGGGAQAGCIDKHQPVRGASIAAHLRHWWRVLEAPAESTASGLRQRESQLFGSVHAPDKRGESACKSAMRVCVTDVRGQQSDSGEVPAAHMYALWPARLADEQWRPRWHAGLAFTLHVWTPEAECESVERALRAYLLFGGYGGRTRRGCGTLWVPRGSWWPEDCELATLEHSLGLASGTLRDNSVAARDVPALRGCRLAVGSRQSTADKAWAEALEWLRDFRQEPDRDNAGNRDRAREPGSAGKPGRSRWPEPDKIRQLGAYHDALHKPRYGRQPAWPRAAFGLPIVFSAWEGRNGALQLLWEPPGEAQPFTRLASPLILKALPLARGGFVPLALWLRRAEPADGQVVLCAGDKTVPGSAAPFDRLLGAGDRSLYRPLDGGSNLCEAFFDWLRRQGARVL